MSSKWAALYILWQTGQSHHIMSYDKQGVSGMEHLSHHIFSYNQQGVSDITHFVKGNHIVFFLRPTASEWHCRFCVKCSLITPFLWTTVCEWHCVFYIWNNVSLDLFLWQTASEWHCTVCEMQSQHNFSCDSQIVSDIEHFVKRLILITFFPMTDREWVILHILCKADSSHLFPMTNS